MKLRLTTLIAFISTLPISVHAVTAVEVKSQDVYRAAYCAELNRLSGFPEYEQVSKSVTGKESPFEGFQINDLPEVGAAGFLKPGQTVRIQVGVDENGNPKYTNMRYGSPY